MALRMLTEVYTQLGTATRSGGWRGWTDGIGFPDIFLPPIRPGVESGRDLANGQLSLAVSQGPPSSRPRPPDESVEDLLSSAGRRKYSLTHDMLPRTNASKRSDMITDGR